MYPTEQLNSVIRDLTTEANGDDRVATIENIQISSDAIKALLDFGFTIKTVAEIIQSMNQFNYRDCVQKSVRISANPVYFDQQNDQIIVPNFYDSMGRFNGQCGDIAGHLLINLELRGVRNKAIGHDVYFFSAVGYSSKFFVRNEARHVWILMVDDCDKDGGISASDLNKSVVLDASLGIIECYAASKYHMDIQESSFNPSAVSVELSSSVELSRSKSDLQSETTQLRLHGMVLGLTRDGSYSVSIGFIQEDELSPFVRLGHENGQDTVSLTLDAKTGVLQYINQSPSISLSEEQQVEVRDILTALNTIKLQNIEELDETQRQMLQSTNTIKW